MKKIISNRRSFLKSAGATLGLAAATSFTPTRFAIAANAPVKVGIMLPFTGVYAALGSNIADGMTMRIDEAGGTLGGRPIEYVKVDSEAAPPKAVDNATKLVKGKGVDFVIGPVHSGVGMAMTKVMAKAPQTIMVVPNAGADQLTGAACAPNIFRTSFSNWQTGYSLGHEVFARGHKKVVTLSWNYGAGQQITGGFSEAFQAAGGDAPEAMFVDFPSVEFQAVLTTIAAMKPDAVFVFFAGKGAVKFVTDWAAAGLKDTIALYGAGFLTEGTTQAQGAAAEGLITSMHYADTLDLPANTHFLEAFRNATGRAGDVYGVQGYDTGTLLVKAMNAVDGNTDDTAALIKAMEATTITDSPRGDWHLSKTHNPVQDFYLRQVKGGKNFVIGMAAEKLEDPAKGCTL